MATSGYFSDLYRGPGGSALRLSSGFRPDATARERNFFLRVSEGK